MSIVKNILSGSLKILEGALNIKDSSEDERLMYSAKFAEQRRIRGIENLTMQREFAKKGFKPVDAQDNPPAIITHGIEYSVLVPAFDKANWTAEEQAKIIGKLTTELKNRGVSDDDIHRNKYAKGKYVIVDGEKTMYTPDPGF